MNRFTMQQHLTLPVVSRKALTDQVARIFSGCGVPGADAAIAADLLVRSDLRGYGTHGVSRVRSYVSRIRSQDTNPTPILSFADVAGSTRVDGNGGLGQVVGTRVIEHLQSRATVTSVIGCLIKNSGHLGALGMYALRLAEQGLVSLVMQATPATMAPSSAGRPVIGNNPLAFGCPGPEFPIVFDMATSVVSRGRILLAAQDNQPIPEGWAVDSAGQPTSNAPEALAGWLVPVGDHKGLGLAMIVHVLAAILTNTVDLHEHVSAVGPGSGHVGGCFLVFNPDLILGRATFDRLVTTWVKELTRQPGGLQRLPGQQAFALEAHRRRNGVPLPASTVEALHETSLEVGIEWSLEVVE